MPVAVDSRLELLSSFAIKAGSEIALWISPRDVVVDERVIWKCRYGCPGYSYFLVCPPFTIPPLEFERNLVKYERILLLRTRPEDINRVVVAVERKALSLGFHLSFGLKGGPCKLCDECVTFGERCRKPEEARPSMEGVGIDVFATLKNAGIDESIAMGDTDYRFYGMVLVC